MVSSSAEFDRAERWVKVSPMSYSAKRLLVLAVGSLTLVVGCAQPGPLASRRTTVGSLKASMAQLEHERDVLKTEVAELRSENRRVTEQVAQVEETNGELHTRLDNARNLLRRQGLDSSEMARPDPEPDRGTTTRARARRSPAAQIPHARSSLDIEDEDRLEDDDTPRSNSSFENWNSQSSAPPSQRWLPIANGVSASPKKTVK